MNMKCSGAVQRMHQQQKNLTKDLHLEAIQKVFWQGNGFPCVSLHLRCTHTSCQPCVSNTSFWQRWSSPESAESRRHCTLRVENYFKEIIARDLVLQCFIDTVMEIMPPKKIVLSTSSKRMIQDKKHLIVGLAALKMISGQKSQTTRAKRSIAAFKLRGGSVVGCKVTLRKKGLYSFLDKLVFLALPRSRLSLVRQGIDGNNNFNIGISDPFIFIELEGHYDLFQSLHGIDIVLATSIKHKGMLQLLLSGLQIKL